MNNYKYVKLKEQNVHYGFQADEMDIAYVPQEGKDFKEEFISTLERVYEEFPYHESLLDEPCWSDVIWEMQDNGWDILECDYKGYDQNQEVNQEIIII